jgi:twitching motility protein PilT
VETNAFGEFNSSVGPGSAPAPAGSVVPAVSSPLDPGWTPDAGVAPQLPMASTMPVAVPATTIAPAVTAMPTTRPAAPTMSPVSTVNPGALLGPPAVAPSVAAPAAAPAIPMPTMAPVESRAAAAPLSQAAEATAIASGDAPTKTARTAIGENSTDYEGPNLTDLLIHVLDMQASDLHLTAGARPTMRLHGHLIPIEDQPELTPNVIQRMLYAILTQKQREKFEEHLELDFAYPVPGKARFRVNVYRQRDALGAAFRLIPFEIKKLEDLGVPPTVANFAMLPRGFVLVTGPTGSGKSTTLASIVDLANRQRRDHIMTCEDPIEFLHQHKQCIVNQREVGEDTHSFANALKHVLRQDPDIILVGEMRDLETIGVALTAAETGHLVFATLHTQDAAQTIDRVIDVFPPHQQQQVRVQLAGAIQGVVCQTLCRTPDGKGRVVATEVMVVTPAIRNLIREGKTHQIHSAMQAGGKFGMHTLDQHLAELVKQRKITYETGVEKCHHVEDFNRLCGRG